MSAEPLWRVKTKPFTNSDRSYIEFAELDVPGFTEVEVWPAGDRTPTYEQVAQALKDASVGVDGPDGLYRTMFLDVATRALWALLHGEGDET